jgi:hypothetical protein
MSTKLSKNKPEIIKRRSSSALAIFVDGVGLDRACRRVRRRVDWKKLLQSLSGGKRLIEARYYNLLPHSDDNRQTAFLDNLALAGFSCIIKRLPPKNVEKQVSITVEMASDLMAFALGQTEYPDLNYTNFRSSTQNKDLDDEEFTRSIVTPLSPEEAIQLTKREVILVCPSKEMDYPVSFLNRLGISTITADFGTFSTNKIVTASSDWIDLSLAENIWHGAENSRLST